MTVFTRLSAAPPQASQPWAATLVRTIFDQPDATEVAAQIRSGGHRPASQLPAVAERLANAREGLLTLPAVVPDA